MAGQVLCLFAAAHAGYALSTFKARSQDVQDAPQWTIFSAGAQVQASPMRYKIPLAAQQPDPRVKEFRSPNPQEAPEYSLVMNLHNRPEFIDRVLSSVMLSVRGSYELILFCDGCNAVTLQTAEGALEKQLYRTWSRTPKSCNGEALRQAADPQGSLMEEFFRPQNSTLRSFCGDRLASRCGRLQRAVLVDQRPAIWETAANNRAVLLSKGNYLIILQDDMLMTQIGWNLQLSLPVRLYKDVFSVTARAAHGWGNYSATLVGRSGGGVYVGEKALVALSRAALLEIDDTRERAAAAQSEAVRWPIGPQLARRVDTFFTRPTGNRGPLLYSRERFVHMGFLDEVHFLFGKDEHDLNIRALEEEGWVSGLVPVQSHQLGAASGRFNPGSVSKYDNAFANKLAEDAYKHWRQVELPAAIPRLPSKAVSPPKPTEERPLDGWASQPWAAALCG